MNGDGLHRVAILVFCQLLLIAVKPACDTLELSNGDRVTGYIIGMDVNTVTIETDYGTLEINRDHIVSGVFSMKQEVPSEGLLCHIVMKDEVSDVSGKDQQIGKYGNPYSGRGPDGSGDSAIYTDGGGDYLQIEATSELNNLKEFSISLWLYLTDTSKTQYVISKWSSTTGSQADGKFALSIKGSNAILYLVDGDGRHHSVVTEDAVEHRQWFHLAVCVATGSVTLYVNGISMNEVPLSFLTLFQDTAPIHLFTATSGAEEDWAKYNMVGGMDRFRLYNRPLTLQEVSLLSEGL